MRVEKECEKRRSVSREGVRVGKSANSERESREEMRVKRSAS